nr:MAG TPA: hypothetical protein [Caudoviricetes sp.]
MYWQSDLVFRFPGGVAAPHFLKVLTTHISSFKF